MAAIWRVKPDGTTEKWLSGPPLVGPVGLALRDGAVKLGMLFFMFTVGLEINPRSLRQHGIAALVVAMPMLRTRPAEAQDPDTLSRQTPASLPIAAQAPVGDWTDYGGTLSGQRYSALSQITPDNVGKLELAWTQRTGDLPDRAESVEHKREYHSEATPIHIGDTLYTCTPHSFVQAIDATTGKTKWSWHEDAAIAGNNYLVCRGVTYFDAPAGTRRDALPPAWWKQYNRRRGAVTGVRPTGTI